MHTSEKMLSRYKRQGDCNRCGKCCIVQGCEHLSFQGGLAICNIYKNRFDYCKLWPEALPIVYAECSYYFLDTWENNRIIKPRQI